MTESRRGLLDDIHQMNTGLPGPRCGVAITLMSLDEIDRNDLTEALLDKTVKSTAIVKALRSRDIPIGETTVARHRRGMCACES